MGSSSKKYKEKECRKRRHRSPSYTEEHEPPKEKRHRHKKHHRDKKRDKKPDYESDGSDVIEITDDPEPSGSGQSADSLSVDETNKLRAKLGLKPLEVGDKSDKKRDDGKKKDDWGEFYHKPAENWAEKAEREKLRSRITQTKEKRQLEQKLGKVKLLADSDSDDNVEAWVDKNRKNNMAKKEAEKRAKMLEELDEQFGVSEFVENEKREKRRQQYGEKNLKGLQVEHDVDSFADERDVVLTLKDKGVVDEDPDDVLINVNMVDDEKYRKNLENKKKKIVYNAYEDQEFDELGNPKEKSLLAQYDETIDGAKKDGFRIGYDNAIERKQALVQSIKEKLAKKRIETIEQKDLRLASEYYNEEELLKFKKPKKKVRKMRTKGKLTADELEQQVNNKGIEEVGSRRPKKAELDDMNIDDVPDVDIPTDMKLEDDKDEILEKALHKARKIKQKENLIAEIVKATPVKSDPDEGLDNGNIILNATAEFCRTLGDIPTYGKSGNREETEELIDYEKDIKDEAEVDEVEEEEKTGWNSVDPNETHEVAQIVPQEVQILDEEPDVSTGMGAALKLAMSKGYLDKEQNKRPSNSRLAHLQAKHYSIEDKTYGDEGDRANRRERYTGPIMEFKERDGFKPNVKLEYIDDDGHILNSKEAFRYLSHKFHGKGPGKNKIEKRIKKSLQEQLMKKMSSTDTPLGTLNMLQAKQKETQSPFVVLSGNKQTQSTVISKTRR
jgi:U4/U6.U5 tri-snRNP-associated protein 1